jgi:hypothetical protein
LSLFFHGKGSHNFGTERETEEKEEDDCFLVTLFLNLEEQRSSAHAARGGNGGDEGRQGGHDDFHCDFQDSFLFLVHSFRGF